MRALTGAIYVALVVVAAWAGPVSTALLFLPMAVLAAREWHLLHWKAGTDAPPITHTILLSAFTYIVAAVDNLWHPWDGPFAPGLIMGAFILLTIPILTSRTGDPGKAFTGHLGTILYATLPMLAASTLVEVDRWIFIGFMVLLWTNDTGAYLVGSTIGRHKLLPDVSPGKTWEGFAGGLLLTVLMGWVISTCTDVLSPGFWSLAAMVVALTATIGDLFESALKRAAGVKDSGKLLPGHGGILDRFDGYLLAAPAMVMLVMLAMGR